jgi:hypothetical protein
MHDIEPFYNWRHLYKAEYDERSPFYGRHYNTYEYTNKIYNYLIHPQWDSIDSDTLYIKLLFVDYAQHFAIIELFGEWNDAINNDIMFLKRNVIDELIYQGIRYFILIGENVLNFHSSDDSYYEEWYEDLENEGWIMLINFRQHVLDEMKRSRLHHYLIWSDTLNDVFWRKTTPHILFSALNEFLRHNYYLKEE